MKNWCFWTVVLEKTLESPLDSKEIKPVNPKGNQSWIFIGRTDAEAELPILWAPNVKSLLTGKDPDAGKDWGQEEKGMTEDEMVGWQYWLNGCDFEQTPGNSEGQGSLACCSPWGRQPNNNNLYYSSDSSPLIIFASSNMLNPSKEFFISFTVFLNSRISICFFLKKKQFSLVYWYPSFAETLLSYLSLLL